MNIDKENLLFNAADVIIKDKNIYLFINFNICSNWFFLFIKF